MPLISIIIPAYNGEQFITHAVDSALAQDFTDREVIVVDDGSTDATAAILSGYENKIFVLHQENGGPSAARNAGAARAQGDYLAFLDADDWWREDKLTLTLRALETQTTAVLAFSGYRHVISDGFDQGYFQYEKAPSFDDMFVRRVDIPPSTVLMRRSVFEDCGGFPNELRAFEDGYLWLLARERGEFIYLNELLTIIRRRASYCYEEWHSEEHASWFRNAKKFEQLVFARYGKRAVPIFKQNNRDLASMALHEVARQLGLRNWAAASRWWIRAARLRPLEALSHVLSAVPSKLVRLLDEG